MRYVFACLFTAILSSSLIVNVALYEKYTSLERDNNRAKIELGKAYYAALYNDAGVDRALELLADAIQLTDVCVLRLQTCQRFDAKAK